MRLAIMWNQLIPEYSPEDLVATYTYSMGLSYNSWTWNWDQRIISRILLKTGLCIAPVNNGIWPQSGLKAPNKAWDDSATCFHGMKKWEDCTMVKGPEKHPMKKCSRWHFYPTEREAEVQAKYEEILAGKYDLS